MSADVWLHARTCACRQGIICVHIYQIIFVFLMLEMGVFICEYAFTSAMCDLYMCTCVWVSDCGMTIIPVHSPASSSQGQLRGTLPDAGTPTAET